MAINLSFFYNDSLINKVASAAQAIVSDLSKSTFKLSESKTIPGLGKVRGSTVSATRNLNNQNLYTNLLTGPAPKVTPFDIEDQARKAANSIGLAKLVDTKLLKPRSRSLPVGPAKQSSFKASSAISTQAV